MELILEYFPNLTQDQIEQFSKLKSIYTNWNNKINVISRKDIENINLRHVLHSLSIAKFIEFKEGTTILDLGTGGGFPGIPLAILFPNCKFNLVDSIKKKILVVDQVSKELGLNNVTTHWSRAEKLDLKFDFLVTRAVAKMNKIIDWSENSFNLKSNNDIKNGIIALKGGDIQNEISVLTTKKIIPISEIINDDYFTDKKIIYVPSKLSYS
jgi:16S rRNA (guanine527-N7)-methyltransferase